MNKTKPSVFKLLALIIVSAAALTCLVSGAAFAAVPVDCPDGTTAQVNPPVTQQKAKDACKGHENTGPSSTKGVEPLKNDCKAASGGLNKTNCGIINMIVTLTNILSGIVGVVIVAAIVIGGIQYSSAAGDPQKVVAARGRIRAAVTALILYIFMFAFLQWVIPGGLF